MPSPGRYYLLKLQRKEVIWGDLESALEKMKCNVIIKHFFLKQSKYIFYRNEIVCVLRIYLQ